MSNEFKQPVLSIGMVGHIDHGKTTLLWQLSGKWTDTHSEELKRGITIKLGYADVMINKCNKCEPPLCFTREKTCKNGEEAKPYRYISFIDVPGHEMLMAAMLSGAAIIDAAILVIAANEHCPRPQTREHLVALEAKGIKNIIIVQNKVDLVSREDALKNFEQIKQFVKGTIAENSPIIPCSAQQGINIDMIFSEICNIPIPKRDTHSKPLFFIARSFDVNKPGTKMKELQAGVIGGVLRQGMLRQGDMIEIKPGLSIKKHNITEYKTIKTKILKIYSGNAEIKEAFPSGSLALQTNLDPMMTKADSLAGCVVSKVNELPEIQNRIKIRAELFKEVLGTETKQAVDQLKTSELLMLSINTSITVGTVVKIGKDAKEIEVTLKIPIIAIPGTKIGMARNVQGHFRLIGWGEILQS